MNREMWILKFKYEFKPRKKWKRIFYLNPADGPNLCAWPMSTVHGGHGPRPIVPDGLGCVAHANTRLGVERSAPGTAVAQWPWQRVRRCLDMRGQDGPAACPGGVVAGTSVTRRRWGVQAAVCSNGFAGDGRCTRGRGFGDESPAPWVAGDSSGEEVGWVCGSGLIRLKKRILNWLNTFHSTQNRK
jgi:hypothetical protein